ncbi:hypothetical protein BLNAU_8274 [Blattamonas nauphoetae]|uniref:Uncharacterized protein n=1 Tax=Blattamonas nauphoetae TaxID=2049346 RepID=A0ABQ9XZB1_9EUKA|nr:hypothetical protein BLNAU_8274 [Blattamonas nauphoetae]
MFTNEQPISDDETVRVSDMPIPSFPRILVESNEHPTIETDTDPPIDGNADVSTMPRISPTSFENVHFIMTTDEEVEDSSIVDDEITIALVHGDTSILLSDIVSMLLDTTAKLSTSEKPIHFSDSVELVKQNIQVTKSYPHPSSVFEFTSDVGQATRTFYPSVRYINVVPKVGSIW